MKFRPRLLPTLFTVLGLALLLALGTWQAKRYGDRKAFEESRDARIDLSIEILEEPQELLSGEVDFRRITVTGTWDDRALFLIRHRIYRGEPGFWAIALLHLDRDGGTAPVNLGWLPLADGPTIAESLLEGLPREPQTLVALVHVLDDEVPDRDFRADPPDLDGVLTLTSYDATAILELADSPFAPRPFFLTLGADADAPHGALRPSYDHITEPYLTSETHFGYALTWYTLAGALLLIWIAASLGLLHSRGFDEPST